jgi:hypothetical protein
LKKQAISGSKKEGNTETEHVLVVLLLVVIVVLDTITIKPISRNIIGSFRIALQEAIYNSFTMN